MVCQVLNLLGKPAAYKATKHLTQVLPIFGIKGPERYSTARVDRMLVVDSIPGILL